MHYYCVKNFLYLEFGMVAKAKSTWILHYWGVDMTNSNAPSNFFFEVELSNVDPDSHYIINLEEERQA